MIGNEASRRELTVPSRRFRNSSLAAAALCALVLGWWQFGSERALPKEPAAVVPVQIAVVEPHAVQVSREGLGTVLAWNTMVITPQVSGQVIDLPFHEGGSVRAGDILVQIDSRPFKAILDEANARRNQDQSNLWAAEKNLSRDQVLLGKGGFATQQTVDNEQAQVDALKATIAGDQAAREAAQLNLDYATIRAQFAGIASLRNVDVGNVVTNTTDIASIAQIEPIAVVFTLPQADLAEVQAATARGQLVVHALDQDGKGPLAQGTLEAVNNQVDPTSGTIKLKAVFDNKEHKLWPGAFVQVRLVVHSEQGALAVPSEAVQRGPDGPYIWVVSPDETARAQPVKLEEIQGGETVVADGLAPGDRIIVGGQYRLTPGAPVTESSRPGAAQADRRGW